ncbi:RNF213 [Mytilus edulis]|uniref:RNF213 n=1 Tax=Mytilus edulis TaxID=6550 RepID=A0A8S3RY85_MYTED|nr:RNF213 [Mytilus edulis]
MKKEHLETEARHSGENANNIKENDDEFECVDEEQNDIQVLDDVTRCLVLAIGICYHACLKDRKAYREAIAGYFTYPLVLPGGPDDIEQEISSLQPGIEGKCFAMIVCIELRIPLFLVGKPGSSKSLAKSIIADAMQGGLSKKDFFKDYKQVQMMSFQCSPISVPEGIVGTFRQCSAYQKDKNLDKFVSVVVLDEIGLAEDSPRMPLKGCISIRVVFIFNMILS